MHSVRGFLYKHSLVRRRNARSSGDEEGSAKHQTRVRSCGCAVIFLHQRNEWHNEGTPLNVRAPSVALPEGLCRRQKGETREEGGYILDMFALSFIIFKKIFRNFKIFVDNTSILVYIVIVNDNHYQ